MTDEMFYSSIDHKIQKSILVDHKIIADLLVDCRPCDLYSGPSLNLAPSPFSCPKMPCPSALPLTDHSTIPFVFSEDTSEENHPGSADRLKPSPKREEQSPRREEQNPRKEEQSPSRAVGAPVYLKERSIKKIINALPLPSTMWVIGGNPRKGVVGVSQTLVISNRPLVAALRVEQEEDDAENSQILGHEIARGIRLRLISIPRSVNQSDENSAVTEKWTDFVPVVVPFQWKVVPNDNGTCTFDFVCSKYVVEASIR